MTACRFLEPLDVLFLRGNKLFGDPGSYGEFLVPPWPSVAAGALRSQMMVEEGVDFEAFRNGEVSHPALGTLDAPGPFTVTGFYLARQAGAKVETLHPLPADLVALKGAGGVTLKRLRPVAPATGILGSQPLERWPVLAADRQAKPQSGLWLTQAGWARYLAGGLPTEEQVVSSDKLWKIDPRVGIGLDSLQRRADDGRLFTVQAVTLNPGVGFLALIEGAAPPETGTLRFGGDGRAAALRALHYTVPEPDYEALCKAGRCRIVLTSPGLFPEGWRLPGMAGDSAFALGEVRGRIVAAAVPRAETISGWDLARRRPKDAWRAAPAGSVYWIEALQATPEALRRLAARGLWPESGYDAQRRAEGFNRFTFAIY